MTDPKRDVQDVRAQFEAWAVSEYPQVPGVSSGSQMHIDLAKQRAWPIWQAALQSPAVRELVEAGNDWCDLMPGLAGGPEFDRLVAALRTLGAGHVE